MAMRRSLFALPLLCLSLVLAGCENMDPAYWLPDNKKKLPGERREVFPEGVPGVIQGVPPELVKGNAAAQAEGDAAAAAPQAEPAPVQEKRQPTKSRPRKVVRPIQPPPDDAQAEQQTQPRQTAPRQAQPAQSGGAWPSPQAAQQPQQQQQQAPAAASGWPSPPAAGTFTR